MHKKAVYAESVAALVKHVADVYAEVEPEVKPMEVQTPSGTDGAASTCASAGASAGVEDDDIAALELQILRQTVQATIKHLRHGLQGSSRPKLAYCLDNNVDNQVCAILVAAALRPSCIVDDAMGDAMDCPAGSAAHPECKLILGPVFGEADVSTMDAVMSALQTVVINPRQNASSASESGAAFGAAQSIRGPDAVIDDLQPGQDVFLFATTAVRMSHAALDKLKAMDCSVRAHNVSLLLQKGEVRALGDDVEAVHLDLGSGTSAILCGACIMADGANSQPHDIVHYCNRASRSGGAVKHSGDTRDDDGHSCHTIDADLTKVDPAVMKMWFTLCSCGASSLAGFTEPRIRFVDKRTDQPLCEYRLQKSGEAMSVVMACLIRNPAHPDQWSVQAVGGSEAEVKSRCCCNYGIMDPVLTSLTELGVGNPESLGAGSKAVFDEHDVQAVSSSVGGEISKLRQLCRMEADHDRVKKVKQALKEQEGTAAEATVPTFELTSLDVLYLQLARLPMVCQEVANAKLGTSGSLLEVVAENVARQILASGQSLDILKTLPGDLQDLVKIKIASFGI
jgi:stress response protein SCP2